MYTIDEWEKMLYGGVGSKHSVEPLPTTSTTATVVEIHRRPRDSYGDAYESEKGGYLIFQAGDRFFKKSFSESSYSDAEIYFYGDVEEVFGEVVTTIQFKPKER